MMGILNSIQIHGLLLLIHVVLPGSEPVNFYKAGRVKVSLHDITKVVEEAGRKFCSPSKLLHGLKLTAIYFNDGSS